MTKIVEMKRLIKYITVFTILASVFSSCDEWLEATSNTQFPADKIFSTKKGFYEALTGVYITMGDKYAYGGSYTWKANDMVAFPYLVQDSENFRYWQNHNYGVLTVENELAEMWKQGYETIANINLILRELDERRDVITYEPEYNLIKGELLALRAYVHFDLMRMFGVSEWNAENAAKKTIPYVTQYNKEPEIQRSYEETEQLLLTDLNTAIQCLSVDPVTGNAPSDFEEIANADGYWNNRNKHLNYYAAKALAARIYQWKNDFDTAAQYAQEVIDGALDNQVVEWIDPEAIVMAVTDDVRDWSFSTEHIFSLEVTQLQSNLGNYLLDLSAMSAIRLGTDLVYDLLFMTSDQSGSIAGAEDVRGPALLLRYGTLGFSCYKLYCSTSYDQKYRNRIPMIKLSEMYYIIAEKLIKDGDNSGALAKLDEVRSHRGITDQLPQEYSAEEELMKEYYREFMSEGQIFYYLKHTKLSPKIWSGFNLTEANLIYPYPQDEINYGRVQEL